MEALIALVALAIFFFKLHLFQLKVGGKITITEAIYIPSVVAFLSRPWRGLIFLLFDTSAHDIHGLTG